LPVPGNLQADLPELRFEGLGREPVPGVAGALGLLVVLFVAQMVGQLALEERLDDLLADLQHEGVKIVQEPDALLLEELFQLLLVQSHRYLLELFYPFKEVYSVFLTVPFSTSHFRGHTFQG